MALQITQMLVPVSKYDIKCPYVMKPEGVTIHETGNKVSAMAEISYMIGNNYEVSYHFAVDDKRAVQGLPLNRNGWHAGDKANGRGNRKTIGVEHCYNWNGVRTTKNDPIYNPLYQEALKNGIELVANLFIQYPEWGAPEHGKNIWRHYDHSGKNCPQRLIEEGKWLDYVSKVKARYLELKGIKTPVVSGTKVEKPKTDKQLADEVIKGIHGTGAERKAKLGSRYDAVQKLVDDMFKPKPVAKPAPIVVAPNKTVTDSYKETGTFYPNDTIIVRNAPSTNAAIVARYYQGEHVKYHTVHLKNGYVWLQYTRANGQQGYIPCRTYSNGKYGTLWGTIK